MERPASANIYQLLRLFRHDLLNDLQMVLGYLQLGHSPERIYEETSKMVVRIQAVSSLFSCQDDELATLLWHYCVVAQSSGIRFEYRLEPLSAPLDEVTRLTLGQAIGQVIVDLSKVTAKDAFLHININGEHCLLRCTPLLTEPNSQSLAASSGWHLEKTNTDWRYSYVY